MCRYNHERARVSTETNIVKRKTRLVSVHITLTKFEKLIGRPRTDYNIIFNIILF